METNLRRFGLTLVPLVLVSWLVPIAATQGDVIVNWQGNYHRPPPPGGVRFNETGLLFNIASVDGDRENFDGNYQGDGAPLDTLMDDSIGGRLFSDTVPFSPQSDYGGLGGLSETFYGGATTVKQDDTSGAVFDELEVQNHGPNDDFHIHLSTRNHEHDVHLLLYWDKDDFLSGSGATDLVGFDVDSTAIIRIGEGPNEAYATAEVRLLVRDGGDDTWWLSNHVFTPLDDNTVYVWNNANQGLGGGDDGSWHPYDPYAVHPGLSMLAGSDLHLDTAASAAMAKTFDNITAIGFLYEDDYFHNNLEFHIDGFSATLSVNDGPSGPPPPPPPPPGTVVPEPGSIAIWTLLGFSLATLGWHRNRQSSS